MKLLTLALLSLCFLTALVFAQNPLPYLNQPLIPVSAAPGGPGFTLTVSGTGFAAGAVLEWSGSARPTTVVSSGSVHATITAADIAHIGAASVTVMNPAPGGGVSNVIYFPVRRAAPGVAFAPEPGFSPPADPLLGAPSVVGDFNGDGIPDLAVVQNTTNATSTILLYRGNGDGTFSAPTMSPASFNLTSLYQGDFNNDGNLDLVASTIGDSFGSAEAKIFLGNGRGQFAEMPGVGEGDSGGVTGVADLNGDGKLDVLFAPSNGEGGGQVLVLLGNGNGTLTTAWKWGISGGIPGIGDVDHDGKLDLAIPSFHTVNIFLGRGDGTFQSTNSYGTACAGGAVAAADVNGDGNLDLVQGSLCILLGNGDGTFTSATDQFFSQGIPVVADFNGDGKLDVVSFGGLSNTFLGNGDGTFQAPTQSHLFDPNTASAMAFGDLNRDGQLDLVAPFGTAMLVALQTPLSVSVPSLSFGTQKVGLTSPAQTVTLTNYGSNVLTISGIAITGTNAGDFQNRSGCSSGLRPGASCQVKVVFKPTATGSRSAALSVTYAGTDNPQSIAVTGFGN